MAYFHDARQIGRIWLFVCNRNIKKLCLEYDININTGHQVGIFPFSIRKFMSGDLSQFDETDSLKNILVYYNTIGLLHS